MNKCIILFFSFFVVSSCTSTKYTVSDLNYLDMIKSKLYACGEEFCYKFENKESDTIVMDNTARHIEFFDFMKKMCDTDLSSSRITIDDIKRCMPGSFESGIHGIERDAHLEYRMNIGFDCQGRYDQFEDLCNTIVFYFDRNEYLVNARCTYFRADIESKSFDLIQKKLKYINSKGYEDSIRNIYKRH